MSNRFLRLGVNIDHVATSAMLAADVTPIRSGPPESPRKRAPTALLPIFARIAGTSRMRTSIGSRARSISRLI
jgi:hypothetical protein